MDPSSDPGRDDYGLPPVEVEIPDDARDLDRDVQAYHREMRVLRRRNRVRRLVRPIARRRLIIPLVAGCLAVALLSSTLLSVIAGRHVTPPPASASSATPRPNSPASPRNKPLPNAPVTLDGKQVSLRSLGPAVLAWVPVGCGCVLALRALARQVLQAHVRLYLVGTDRVVAELPGLAKQAGQPHSLVVEDGTNALAAAYSPDGLTAILASGDGTVGDVVRNLVSGAGQQQIGAALPMLAQTSLGPAAGTPRPSQPVPQAT